MHYLLYTLYTYIHARRYIRKHVLYGRFKGRSRVIITIRDFMPSLECNPPCKMRLHCMYKYMYTNVCGVLPHVHVYWLITTDSSNMAAILTCAVQGKLLSSDVSSHLKRSSGGCAIWSLSYLKVKLASTRYTVLRQTKPWPPTHDSIWWEENATTKHYIRDFDIGF
jgi:hypothetical protein